MLSLLLLLSSCEWWKDKELLATEVFCALDIFTDLLFAVSLYRRDHHFVKMVFAFIFSAVGICLDIGKAFEKLKYCCGWCTLKVPRALNCISFGWLYADSVAGEKKFGVGKAALAGDNMTKKNKVLKLSIIGAFVEDLPQMVIAIAYMYQRGTDVYSLATAIVTFANQCLKTALMFREKKDNVGKTEEAKERKQTVEMTLAAAREAIGNANDNDIHIAKAGHCECGAKLKKRAVSKSKSKIQMCRICKKSVKDCAQVYQCTRDECRVERYAQVFVTCVECYYLSTTTQKEAVIDSTKKTCRRCDKVMETAFATVERFYDDRYGFCVNCDHKFDAGEVIYRCDDDDHLDVVDVCVKCRSPPPDTIPCVKCGGQMKKGFAESWSKCRYYTECKSIYLEVGYVCPLCSEYERLVCFPCGSKQSSSS